MMISSLNYPKNSSTPSDGTTTPKLNSPSSETVSESRKSILDDPKWIEFQESWQEASKNWREEMEQWWESLSDEHQQWAFYNVCRGIYKGDVEERRSYRGVLYDTFGWGCEAYTLGMEARYMEIHNLLYDAVENNQFIKAVDEINQELNDAQEYDRSQERLG